MSQAVTRRSAMLGEAAKELVSAGPAHSAQSGLETRFGQKLIIMLGRNNFDPGSRAKNMMRSGPYCRLRAAICQPQQYERAGLIFDFLPLHACAGKKIGKGCVASVV